MGIDEANIRIHIRTARGGVQRRCKHGVMEAARNLCQEDYLQELNERGLLPPSRKISPLTPPLRMEEYGMMERDRGKCNHPHNYNYKL